MAEHRAQRAGLIARGRALQSVDPDGSVPARRVTDAAQAAVDEVRRLAEAAGLPFEPAWVVIDVRASLFVPAPERNPS